VTTEEQSRTSSGDALVLCSLLLSTDRTTAVNNTNDSSINWSMMIARRPAKEDTDE